MFAVSLFHPYCHLTTAVYLFPNPTLRTRPKSWCLRCWCSSTSHALLGPHSSVQNLPFTRFLTPGIYFLLFFHGSMISMLHCVSKDGSPKCVLPIYSNCFLDLHDGLFFKLWASNYQKCFLTLKIVFFD